MTKNQLVFNPFLIAQIEASGVEVKKTVKKGKLLNATTFNPLERLHNKGILTKKEYHAGIRYSNDYELANRSQHSRPNYDGSSPNKYSKPSERILPQSQLDAAERYELAKMCIFDLEQREKLKLPQILTFIFEQSKSFNCTEIHLKINHKLLEERVKLICQTLLEL